ncbi:MAG: hypothetical protein GEU76_03950 [Alphaproteobacteria bacterium]|nr:hypothetical protein [Alphaproteobacteria bacterium]
MAILNDEVKMCGLATALLILKSNGGDERENDTLGRIKSAIRLLDDLERDEKTMTNRAAYDAMIKIADQAEGFAADLKKYMAGRAPALWLGSATDVPFQNNGGDPERREIQSLSENLRPSLLQYAAKVRDRAEIGRETYTEGAAKSVSANTRGPSHIKFTEALYDLYRSRVRGKKPTHAPKGEFCRLIAAVIQYRDGVESPPKSFRRWAQSVIQRAKIAGEY